MSIRMEEKWCRRIAVLLAAVLLLSLGGQHTPVVNAATGFVSHNIHHEDYYEDSGNWASNVKSYLYQNRDGSITRVEAVDSSIIVETYNSSTFALQGSQTTIPMELPLFGGFYAGDDYNYIVFGQANSDENNDTEVFRIVQYDKNWNKLKSAGLSDVNTTMPFVSGSLRFCEYQDMIYVRTSHRMYRSNDGVNHQANATFSYNEKTGVLKSAYMGSLNLPEIGCVNRSYNQFIKVDNGQITALDHVADDPRSLMLFRYNAKAGGDIFADACSVVKVCSLGGNANEEYTGAAVGGFEISGSHYLAAFQSVDQKNDFHGNGRNIYLGKVPRSDFAQPYVQTERITSYTSSDFGSVSNPILVKVSNNSFVMLWEKYDLKQASDTNPDAKGTNTLQFIKLDGAGNHPEGVQTVNGSLSDCQPLVIGNKIIWYVTENSMPKFYTLDLTTNRITEKNTDPAATATPVASSSAGPSASASVTPSVSPSVRPTATPTATPIRTPRPTGTPVPVTTPRPTASPYPPYDVVVPDDSDLEINDDVGPENPTWDDINSNATQDVENNNDNNENNNGDDNNNNTPIFVPEKGASISNASAQYVVTGSDDTFGTVEYYKPKTNKSSVKIPDTVRIGGITYDVTSIADGAFKNNTHIKSVEIGDGVTRIGARAFSGCKNLKKAELGTDVEEIGAKAFYNCKKLSKITIPSNVSKIGKQALAGCSKMKNLVFKTTELTDGGTGANVFKGIPQNAVVKVPKEKKAAYKKLFRRKGLNSKIKFK